MSAAEPMGEKQPALRRVQHPAVPVALSVIFLALCGALAWFAYSLEPYVNYLPANEWIAGITRRQARLLVGQPWLALILGIVVGLCTVLVWTRALKRQRARNQADGRPAYTKASRPSFVAAPQQIFLLALGLLAAWNLELSLIVFLPAIMIPHGLMAFPHRINYRDQLDYVRSTQGAEAAERLRRDSRARAVLASVLAVVAVGAIAYTLTRNQDTLAQHREIGLVLKGAALDPQAGAELAAALEQSPNDQALRAQALGYYRSQTDPQGQSKHAEQVFWLIEQRPHTRVAGLPEAALHHREYDRTYAQGSALWEKQVARHPETAQVWANAAYYHALIDPERSMAYLTRALALEPYQRNWQNLMAYLQSPRARDERREENKNRPSTLLELPVTE